MEVHAYDHPDVLAGQGTVGGEFEHDAPELTHVLVATGGGGLIGGIAAWYAGSARGDQRRAGGLVRRCTTRCGPVVRCRLLSAGWPPTASARGRSAD